MMEDRIEGCRKPVRKFRKKSDDDDGEKGCDLDKRAGLTGRRLL